jgi:hypothetical protein
MRRVHPQKRWKINAIDAGDHREHQERRVNVASVAVQKSASFLRRVRDADF